MKDSDLVPAIRPVVLSGPTVPPPPVEEKRGPGRPAGSGATTRSPANVKPLSTERLLELKEVIEAILVSAGEDPEAIDKISTLQLDTLDLEKMLINRRKGTRPL